MCADQVRLGRSLLPRKAEYAVSESMQREMIIKIDEKRQCTSNAGVGVEAINPYEAMRGPCLCVVLGFGSFKYSSTISGLLSCVVAVCAA